MPSVSKNQLSARMKRKTLNLNKKNYLIDFAKKNPTFGCQKLGETHRIGKTSVAGILKTRKKIERNSKSLKVSQEKVHIS